MRALSANNFRGTEQVIIGWHYSSIAVSKLCDMRAVLVWLYIL